MAPTEGTPHRYYRREGFGLGTAILTASQLKEMHTRITQAFGRLQDPVIAVLEKELKQRLILAGVEVSNILPIRAFANRSIIDHAQVNKNCLAHQSQLEKLEEAILERRTVFLDTQKHGNIRVWPLQIIFQNIAWYLAYETTDLSPVLVVSRLDRLRLISRQSERRGPDKMREALERLHNLFLRTGGIYLGSSGGQAPESRNIENPVQAQLPTLAEQQRDLAAGDLTQAKIQHLISKGVMQPVRFRCSAQIYQFMRQGNNRYPADQMLLSGPLPEDDWTLDRGASLQPDPTDISHPYPVELILPSWTVERDLDFRRWLFGFGNQIRIEAPDALRDEHRHFGAGIASLYDAPSSTSMPPEG